MRLLSILMACLVCFGVGFYAGSGYEKKTNHTNTTSSVMLERIKDVFKIVNIEAQFNELYSHKDYTWFDVSPFRKTAIIRIQANVLAGINADTSKMIIDEKTKTIKLTINLTPQILAIDHKLDYYDLQQGTFNYFSPNEMTELQEKAKEQILQKALTSDLLQRTSKRMNEMLGMLQQLAIHSGWNLEIKDEQGKQIPFKN